MADNPGHKYQVLTFTLSILHSTATVFLHPTVFFVHGRVVGEGKSRHARGRIYFEKKGKKWRDQV
jgi:hypothetical protein